MDDIDDIDMMDYVSRCLICADIIDYCQGHGEAALPVWEAHDDGDHSLCHPDACTE